MPKAGETPGPGQYECVQCGHIEVLSEDGQPLPVCPVCGCETYEKIE